MLQIYLLRGVLPYYDQEKNVSILYRLRKPFTFLFWMQK